MHILLLQSTSYLPSIGANKANRLLLEALTRRGHRCRALGPVSGSYSSITLTDALIRENISFTTSSHGALRFAFNGVEVSSYATLKHLLESLQEEVLAFDPTWILTTSEDFGQRLLRAATTILAEKVIFLARTTQYLPFGPTCFWPSRSGTESLRKAKAIIAVSKFVQKYIEEHANLASTWFPLPSFGAGPFPDYSSAQGPYVLMINPCAIKGVSVFAAVARALPDHDFAAVPTWGTTADDLCTLNAIENVTILESRENIEEIYAKTRVLLVPSLWDDSFPKVVIEAMARAIPVVASNAGGLPETKLGVDYVLPVNTIKEYTRSVDQRMVPLPVIPDQDFSLWIDTVSKLLASDSIYARVSRESRSAALQYVAESGVEKFETFVESLSGSTMATRT